MATINLFKWLEKFSKLGSPGNNSVEQIEELLNNLEENFLNCVVIPEASPDVVCDAKNLLSLIRATVSDFLSSVDEDTKCDARIVCGCHVIAVLQEVHKSLVEPSTKDVVNASGHRSGNTSSAPPDLISVQQTKIVEDVLRFVFYTLILGCLSPESSQYVKVMIIRNKFVLGKDLASVSLPCHHSLLTQVMKMILPFLKHPSLGVPLRGPLFPEVLSAMLELSFAPGKVKDHPEDTAYFREQLEKVLSLMGTNQSLQHLLLLKGIAKKGGWLQKVCGSFIVRRYLMQPNGVASVIGAGLTICNGQDWKNCEAIAALVSQAKFSDIDMFYSTIGPQVSALMLEKNLKPEILCVVTLVVSDLAQKSVTLTSLHVTNALIQPLLDITTYQAVNSKIGSNLTMCVTCVHKLFVEVGIPSAPFLNLLRPVIDPLMAIATFPASHLRSLAQQCLVRFLTQQSTDGAIEVLLHISRLCAVPTIPTINPSVTLYLDEGGGVKTDVIEPVDQEKTLQNDEELAKEIVTILELLKNPLLVRCFYEKLVLYIDFSVLNERPSLPTTLLTNDDIRANQFEAVRRVYISCSLLSHLADSEQLTNDLFHNLSLAVPIVDTLLRTSCQRCDDEMLNKTRLSFLLNVVMMVSCYVSNQILLKKMSSDDWEGLKLLLPSLEDIKKTISDEAIALFVDQLRNIVLTHGVVLDLPKEKKRVEGVINRGGSRKEDKDTDKASDGQNQLSDVKVGETSSSRNIESDASKSPKIIKCEKDVNDMQNKESSCKISSFSIAMEDVVSPILPTRGHGLLSLSKLIEERDSEALSHRKQLLALFQHSLKEEDSYVYLMAIQGLAVLCDAFPGKVIETLTREFSLGNRSPEDKAKLAEALVRACKRLGPLLPHYKCHFINSLLSGIRDKEPIIRASSLSSLGEVCKILRFSLDSILHEIFGVLQAVIDTDKAVEVRRAALLVVTLILQGLGHDAFSVLKSVIRDLYRVLRLVHARDSDDVVRLHAQLAIEEIDNITKEFLLPKLNLTKRIYVADIPPNQI